MEESRKCKCGQLYEPAYRNGILVSKLCYGCIVAKSRAKTEKQRRAETKAMKEKLKKKSAFEKDLQDEINLIARLIDKGQPCIARPNLPLAHGGHFRAVASAPAIRFHLDNVHGQSVESNKHKGGEPLEYREGLIRVYGIEYCNYVESLKSNIPSLKLSIEELKEAISRSRQFVKELKARDMVYSAYERIELRKIGNKVIEIYK